MITRAIGLFFGGFVLFNLLVGSVVPGFNTNHWWFDFWPLPNIIEHTVVASSAILILAWSVKPSMSRSRERTTLVAIGILALVAAYNVVLFYMMVARGSIVARLPLPLSAVLIMGLLAMAQAIRRPKQVPLTRRGILVASATLAACAILIPMSQIIFFGNTDYRRSADVAVVFGARTYADGRPSNALTDRVRTACELYQSGLVKTLVFSGGPGDGPTHETEAMHKLARKLGVPESAIRLDLSGTSTHATVANLAATINPAEHPRIIAVSHFYHLPRIKLEFERAGLNVYTVPAPQNRVLMKLPMLVVREIAALWVYYLRWPR